MRTTQITEVNRSWWYRSLRAMGAFCFRYWWLVWLFFIIYLLLWYLFCFNLPLYNCNTQQEMKDRITAINQNLDSCCNCTTEMADSANSLPPNTKPCDYDQSVNGGKGNNEYTHNLGSDAGIVNIDYNMQNIPDKISIYYDGKLVASSGKLVSGTGSISFYYPAEKGKPTYCKVVLYAPEDNTVWSYHIGCPR